MSAPSVNEKSVCTPELVRETLAEYGALTRDAIQKYLPTGTPRRYLYDLIADYPQRGGKMMRSSLCIATARAFGASLDDALRTAAAIELLHNALLIHDDIEDGSELRRGRPTLHALHGTPLALNAGDALSLLSLRPLIENIECIGPRRALRVLEETERMAWESAEGQAMELGWRRDNCNDLTDADYLTMVLKKTCWLAIIHPCRVGALIGTHDGVDLEPFIRFGFFLGAAFQIQDDLLNLVADERYGKERHGDIVEGKRTLMLNHTCRQATPAQRGRLAAILDPANGPPTGAQVEWISDLMVGNGSIEYARGIAHGLAGAALHEYADVFDGVPDSRDKRFIQGLVTWVFERT
jgi:geranylgeranyl diphosphate synthase type II